MFRDSTAANGANAFVWVTPGNNVEFQTRASDGASSSYSATVSAGSSPVWVRLVRSGNQFTAYYSLNGTSWTQVGTTQTVTMPTSALAGLAVCSDNTAALNTSVIDNVTLSGLAMRGRPKLNAAHTTFVADDGQLLRPLYVNRVDRGLAGVRSRDHQGSRVQRRSPLRRGLRSELPQPGQHGAGLLRRQRGPDRPGGPGSGALRDHDHRERRQQRGLQPPVGGGLLAVLRAALCERYERAL